MKLKLKMSMKILVALRKCLISVIVRLTQNTMTVQQISLLKMKDETGGVANEPFASESKKYSFLVDNNEHKKVKGVNKNVVAMIGHNGYKGVLLNNKCMKHSVNKIKSKDYWIGTYEIDKTSLSSFDDKIYIKNNGYDGLARVIRYN